MDTVRVRNLRSLADTGEISLSPLLTLLVGENSSGKSTFIRFFPLLRQSTETPTSNGLLLRGAVDYGLFHTALKKGAHPAEISFGFGLTLEGRPYADNPWPLHDLRIKLEVSFCARKHEPNYSYFKGLEIRFGTHLEDRIVLEATEDGRLTKLVINDLNVEAELEGLALANGPGLIPALRAVLPGSDGSQSVSPDVNTAGEVFDQALLKLTENSFHRKTSRERKLALFHSVRIGEASAMLSELRKDSELLGWQSSIAHWDTKNPKFRSLRDVLLAGRLPKLLTLLAFHVRELARGVHYFAPVRAQVFREYAVRDLTVEQIAPDGSNVPMFLARLPRSEMIRFQEWTRAYFNFEIYGESFGDGSLIALRLRDNSNGQVFNLTDTGFGYSQMLPFLLQIWALVDRGPSSAHRSSNRIRNTPPRSGYLIAIEQPELHLHPAFQSRILDLMIRTAKIAREQGLPAIRFVLETHSPTFVERAGHLIAAGQLAPADAQVIFFEREEPESASVTSAVRHASYDADGVLSEEFPMGFFLSSAEGLDFPTPIK